MNTESRQKYIAALNKRVETPTADELRSLKEHNCETWGEWIVDQADNNGISVGDAYGIWQMLGPSEAFDGFVTSCEDAAMEMEGCEDEE
jgi:hypothetical protein